MTDASPDQSVDEEQSQSVGMRPIWFFVGLVLLAIGAVLLVTGLYYLVSPAPSDSAVAYLHPNLWWGGVMVIAGGIFLYTSKDVRIQ